MVQLSYNEFGCSLLKNMKFCVCVCMFVYSCISIDVDTICLHNSIVILQRELDFVMLTVMNRLGSLLNVKYDNLTLVL